MKYQKRTSAYLFTIVPGPTGNEFFNKFRTLAHKAKGTAPFYLSRYGRPQRGAHRLGRYRSRVPVNVADRCDVYIRVRPVRTGTYNFDSYMARISDTICAVLEQTNNLMLDNKNVFVSFNEIYKIYLGPAQFVVDNPNKIVSVPKNSTDTIRTKTPVLTAAGIPPKCAPSNDDWKTEMTNAINKNNQKMVEKSALQRRWKVTVKSHFKITAGPDKHDAHTTLLTKGYDKDDIVSIEPIEEHPELPLVSFLYRENDIYVSFKTKAVRAKYISDDIVEGFEDGVYKIFNRSKMANGEIYIKSFKPELKK